MPEIVALLAPQNVLPALNDSFGLLGQHEPQVFALYATPSKPQLQHITLSSPVQTISFPEASRWVMCGFSADASTKPLLYQQRLALCTLGRCENHQELAREYQLDSHCELSLLLAHMLHPLLQQGSTLSNAMLQIAKYMRGALALIAQDLNEPQHCYAANFGQTLYIGLEAGLRHLCTSSARLIRQLANPIYEIQVGQVIRFGLNSPALCRYQQEPEPITLSSNRSLNVPHHMLEEIESQPVTLSELVDRYLAEKLFPSTLLAKLAGLQHITLVASGSSYHAAMIASYWFESIAGLNTHVEIASEYRYRDIHPHHQELIIAISQSGETADTVEAIRQAQASGHPYCLAVCNAPNSTLGQCCDFSLLTQTGAELSVSSTKSFTAQLLVLFQLAIQIGQSSKRLNEAQVQGYQQEMRTLGGKIHEVLAHRKELRRWAGDLHAKNNLFVIGRNAMYPVALEGAFKFKEVAYQHAAGFAAGELKHGAITLVSPDLPIIACLPWNQHAERMLSNLHDIRANQGELFVLSDGHLASAERFNVIRMPTGLHQLAPITYIVALQLLAYYSAVLRGNSIDTPRNLRKTLSTA